jgi:hypothetical protein
MERRVSCVSESLSLPAVLCVVGCLAGCSLVIDVDGEAVAADVSLTTEADAGPYEPDAQPLDGGGPDDAGPREPDVQPLDGGGQDDAGPREPDVQPPDVGGQDDAVTADAAAEDPDVSDPDVGERVDAAADAEVEQVDAGPEPCEPMTRLGLCEVCDVRGVAAVPEDDAGCALECGTAYRIEDGECVASTLSPARCAAAGVCHETIEGGCVVESEEVVGRGRPRTCERLAGCEGREGPRLETDVGGVCNRFGTCDDDGQCSVPPVCGLLIGDLAACEEPGALPAGFCTVTAASPRAILSCAQLCRAAGGDCVIAVVSEGPGSCEAVGQVDCDESADFLACACAF